MAGSSDLLSLFSLMKMEKANKDSILVIIADASSFTTEEIKFSHLPECPIVVACVLNEFKADTGQIARFMFLSAQVDGLSLSSLMKKGVFERYKPLFKSDFEDVNSFATALSEIIVPCREFVLRCGMFTGTVNVVPADYNCKWEDLIEIIGFVKAVNLGNIPTAEHHFLKYCNDRSEAEGANVKGFLNLLCNTLISEEMAALCRLNSETYGIIGPVKNEGIENCLLIQQISSGTNSVYWLKNLDRVVSKPFTNEEDFKLCLPTDKLPKPSYSSQRTIWDDSFGIQSDMQKILRLLKKIPDRTHAFYSELNRVHGYACTIGAEDIHNKLVNLIEAEGASQSPIVKKHTAYVCAKLRKMGIIDSSEIPPIP
uniref:IntS14_C domain-containing protein n=1 Tax=Syphacia muris TaxID=451379 RepID=A0A0N5AMM3_9BILA